MSRSAAVIPDADTVGQYALYGALVEGHQQLLLDYNIEKDIAAYVKKEFDKKYNLTWHCIVGRNCGIYVTHETKIIYIYIYIYVYIYIYIYVCVEK
uniref:Dynein light chain n=1 Tax=Xiphophorus maculatus TaxID=8083 RepID=A0A3B5RDE6_XIPMA